MKFIFLLIPLLFVSCTGNNLKSSSSLNTSLNASSSLGVEFTLGVGQEMSISGEDLNIKFTAVTNDSRCPVDAECAVAGSAEVSIEVTKAGSSSSTIPLNTPGNLYLSNRANYLNYTIQISDLQPYPKVDSTIPQADYKAKFIVSKP